MKSLPDFLQCTDSHFLACLIKSNYVMKDSLNSCTYLILFPVLYRLYLSICTDIHDSFIVMRVF